MSLREVAQQALEALEYVDGYNGWVYVTDEITALRAALAEPTSQESRQVEPVAWVLEDHGELIARKTTPPRDEVSWREKCELPAWVPLYTAPPKREPLTEEEIDAMAQQHGLTSYKAPDWFLEIVRDVEQAYDIGGKK